MLNNDDLKWIAATSTELNAMLQQISRYSDLARQHKGEYNYITCWENASRSPRKQRNPFSIASHQEFSKAHAQTKPRRLVGPAVIYRRSFRDRDIIVDAAEAERAESRHVATAGETLGGKRNSRPATRTFGNQKSEWQSRADPDCGRRSQVAELAAEMLTDEGYKVIIAHDGFEALRIYEKMGNHIGLVILDFFLPVMDGDAVFDELRSVNPDINVVLSSGFAEQSKLGNMLAQGLRGFIPKPYTREKLLEQVRSTLDARDTGLRADQQARAPCCSAMNPPLLALI